MKYKLGDKVRYDGDDCWFYATVCAVFDHPVSPCYRLNVERLEKKNCRFFINQFEFELQTDDTVVINNDNRFFKFIQATPEPAPKPLPVLPSKPEIKATKRTASKPKRVIKPVPVPMPEQDTQPLKVSSVPPAQKPLKSERTKKPDKWDNRLEEWKSGDRKSRFVQEWKYRSITQYVKGKLSSDRVAKLKEVGILK